MSDWHESSLRHKYDPLPEDGPRHKKKPKKKRVRSDHRHEYEQVCINAHSFVYRSGLKLPRLYLGTRCKVCGRVGDCRATNLQEPPEGMPLYEVPSWDYLIYNKFLPSEMEVSP